MLLDIGKSGEQDKERGHKSHELNVVLQRLVCLVILVTLPVATATSERSSRVMRRVKTYLNEN